MVGRKPDTVEGDVATVDGASNGLRIDGVGDNLFDIEFCERPFEIAGASRNHPHLHATPDELARQVFPGGAGRSDHGRSLQPDVRRHRPPPA